MPEKQAGGYRAAAADVKKSERATRLPALISYAPFECH